MHFSLFGAIPGEPPPRKPLNQPKGRSGYDVAAFTFLRVKFFSVCASEKLVE